MTFNLLAVGDVVGDSGIEMLSRHLPALKKMKSIGFVVVNGENASGVGIHPRQADAIFDAGADVITLGNHTWNRIQIGAYLDKEERILRPANYAGRVPGRGFGVYQCQGLRLGVLNIMGRVDLNSNLDSPFKAANYFVSRGGYDLLLVDFHAEATSEKLAMGYYLDGRVSALWGTHTHVPTADERVYPKGTGYLTDLGMTGPAESVLGIEPWQSVESFLGGLPGRYRQPEGACKCRGPSLRWTAAPASVPLWSGWICGRRQRIFEEKRGKRLCRSRE